MYLSTNMMQFSGLNKSYTVILLRIQCLVNRLDFQHKRPRISNLSENFSASVCSSAQCWVPLVRSRRMVQAPHPSWLLGRGCQHRCQLMSAEVVAALIWTPAHKDPDWAHHVPLSNWQLFSILTTFIHYRAGRKSSWWPTCKSLSSH